MRSRSSPIWVSTCLRRSPIWLRSSVRSRAASRSSERMARDWTRMRLPRGMRMEAMRIRSCWLVIPSPVYPLPKSRTRMGTKQWPRNMDIGVTRQPDPEKTTV